MQITIPRSAKRWKRVAPLVLLAGLGLGLFWKPVWKVAGLALGGATPRGLGFVCLCVWQPETTEPAVLRGHLPPPPPTPLL